VGKAGQGWAEMKRKPRLAQLQQWRRRDRCRGNDQPDGGDERKLALACATEWW